MVNLSPVRLYRRWLTLSAGSRSCPTSTCSPSTSTRSAWMVMKRRPFFDCIIDAQLNGDRLQQGLAGKKNRSAFHALSLSYNTYVIRHCRRASSGCGTPRVSAAEDVFSRRPCCGVWQDPEASIHPAPREHMTCYLTPVKRYLAPECGEWAVDPDDDLDGSLEAA